MLASMPTPRRSIRLHICATIIEPLFQSVSDVLPQEVKLLPVKGSVLGIDIGCSPNRRSSSICRLDWDAGRVEWSLQRFRAVEPDRTDTVAQMLGNRHFLSAAFDGPLRRDLDLIGRYRSAERMLTRKLRPFIGKPGQSSTPVGKALNFHANACADVVLRHAHIADASHVVRISQKAIAEAFPSSFLGLMINNPSILNATRGNRSDTFFCHAVESEILDKLLQHLLPHRAHVQELSAVRNHDERAALICALTALCVAAGEYMAVGDVVDGWIILPPALFVQGWAHALLLANDAAEPVTRIVSVSRKPPEKTLS